MKYQSLLRKNTQKKTDQTVPKQQALYELVSCQRKLQGNHFFMLVGKIFQASSSSTDSLLPGKRITTPT
jgi:hypothetical protein